MEEEAKIKIPRLIAHVPGEVARWEGQIALDGPLLNEHEIEQAERAIISQTERFGLEVFTPWYTKSGRFHRVKSSVCRHAGEEHTPVFGGIGIQKLERDNADRFNKIESYQDGQGFVIQFATKVTTKDENEKMAKDRKRWASTRGQGVRPDKTLIGTVYVNIYTEDQLHESMRPTDPWGYVDIICSSREQKWQKHAIGFKLMQLALLGLMRHGIRHVALDAVRSAVDRYRDWGFYLWDTLARNTMEGDIPIQGMSIMVLKSIMGGWNQMNRLDQWYRRPRAERKEKPVTDDEAESGDEDTVAQLEQKWQQTRQQQERERLEQERLQEYLKQENRLEQDFTNQKFQRYGFPLIENDDDWNHARDQHRDWLHQSGYRYDTEAIPYTNLSDWFLQQQYDKYKKRNQEKGRKFVTYEKWLESRSSSINLSENVARTRKRKKRTTTKTSKRRKSSTKKHKSSKTKTKRRRRRS